MRVNVYAEGAKTNARKKLCEERTMTLKGKDLGKRMGQHRDVFRARNPTLHHGILKANPQLSVAVGRDLDMRQRDVSGGVVGLVDQGRGTQGRSALHCQRTAECTLGATQRNTTRSV